MNTPLHLPPMPQYRNKIHAVYSCHICDAVSPKHLSIFWCEICGNEDRHKFSGYLARWTKKTPFWQLYDNEYYWERIPDSI